MQRIMLPNLDRPLFSAQYRSVQEKQLELPLTGTLDIARIPNAEIRLISSLKRLLQAIHREYPVFPVIASHRVSPFSSCDCVVARATRQRVIAPKTVDRVTSGESVDPVSAIVAREDVGARSAVDILNVGSNVVPLSDGSA